MTYRTAILLAALALSASPPPARAQQGDALVDMARERFQEGVKYFDAKDYEKARAAFLQAYALKKHPAVLLNLAQSELRSGHDADAATHFALFLRDYPSAEAAERQEAERGLAAARTKVGEFTITADQDGAELFVDGEPRGTTPLTGPLYLMPGSHVVEARRASRKGTATVNAVAGQAGSARISLAGGGAAAAGTTPPATTAAPPAPSDTAPPPATTDAPSAEPEPPAEPSGPGRRPFVDWALESPVAWAGAGLTGLGLIGGISFSLAASVAYGDAEDIKDGILTRGGNCNPGTTFSVACAAYRDNADAGDTRKTLAIVSWVVMGLGAAGTVGWYFLDESALEPAEGAPPAARRTVVVPWVAAESAGVAVGGAF